METSPAKNRGKRTYYFGVRVNWDKLLAIDQQKESFKAQIFFEASLLYPKEVDKDDEDAVVTFFHRASVENSLAKRKDDEFPTRTGKAWKFAWLIYGEFGEELELKYFPFDTQDLSVMLRFGWPCKARKDVQVRFVNTGKSKVFLNIFCLKNAWTEPKDIDVRFGFTKIADDWTPTDDEPEVPDQFPLIWIRCQVGRKPTFYLVNVVLPVASIVFASISSLAVFDDMGGRLGATLTLMLTAVAYKYLVAEMVPRIGYNTLLDWYVLVCWFFLLLMVLGNCFVHHHKTIVGLTFGTLFTFFNIVFAVVSSRIHHSERQRLNANDPKQAACASRDSRDSSSDEESEALLVCNDYWFNTVDPQDLSLSLKEVKQLQEPKPNVSPSWSTGGFYNHS